MQSGTIGHRGLPEKQENPVSALRLMVYYRCLPTYQPIVTQPVATHEQDEDVQIEIR